MANLGGFAYPPALSGPQFMGLQSDGVAYYRDYDGMNYAVAPGGFVTTRSGYTIGHPGTVAPGSVGPAKKLPVEAREMPVIGYRGWHWRERFRLGYGNRGSLHSTGMSTAWTHATLAATCIGGAGFHPAPDPNCACGIYVMADMDELTTHISMDDTTIVGAVVGWGRVVQHGREGWRAGHSRILALLDCKFSDAQLKATRMAAKEYGVPILERDGLERYVREWGDPFAEPVKALPEKAT